MAATMMDSIVYAALWSSSRLRAVFEEIPRTQAWLHIIATLAEVQGEFALIPGEAAQAIAEVCRSVPVDTAFLEEVRKGRQASGHSTQGLIECVQRRLPASAAQWVYAGATVQDVTDTWLMLALRAARTGMLEDLDAVDAALVGLSRAHRTTVMAGRTHGQLGLPITFGFKTAGWLAEFRRHRERMVQAGSRMDVVQLCGGVGSVASMGPRGLEVQRRVAERLGLAAPGISWTSSRDVLGEWCALLTLVTGTADRIGHEIYNLQRSEIAEVREGAVRGVVGSITMPHKRNPEIAEHLGTLARLVRHLAAAVAESQVQDHERDGRAWKTEWHAIPEATMLAGRAIELVGELLANVEVDAARMRANLEASGGFVLSEAVMLELAPTIGRDSAHRLLYALSAQAREQGTQLLEVLRLDPTVRSHLDAATLERLSDYARHTGHCAAMVDRVLAAGPSPAATPVRSPARLPAEHFA
ncbi:adenylosuccinate lyase family protein [Thiomonas sp. FB-Cd]|uniref:class-II fumarase/aspartase family protein n=1 Tax=Thiomonas sp. FB-Cd TaxID=1158292 RepID=UPI00068DC28A|nr:adenylosuccinate lyase family protein [Thiomonas sp. FB-Cd]